jgi:hypothetical protein
MMSSKSKRFPVPYFFFEFNADKLRRGNQLYKDPVKIGFAIRNVLLSIWTERV